MLHVTKEQFFTEELKGHSFTKGILAITVNPKKPMELTSQTLHAQGTTLPYATATIPVMIENSLYEKVKRNSNGIAYKGDLSLKEFFEINLLIGKKEKLAMA
jgi:hypothetical protein